MPDIPSAVPMQGLAIRILIGMGISLAMAPWRHLPAWRRAMVSTWLALLATWLATWLGPAIEAAYPPSEPLASQVVLATAWFLVAIVALQVFELVVWQGLLHRNRQRPLPRLLLDLTRFVVVVGAALGILANVFQVDLTALLVTSTVISAVIGLALQDTLRNLIAGIALQVDPPFAIGDWVRVGTTEGEVIAFNWRTLTLRTREHYALVIPNGKVSAEELINFQRPAGAAAQDMKVGVAYPHPPGEVKAVLMAAAREAEGVLSEPAPRVYVEEYADFAIVYRVRVWMDDWGQKPQVRDAVMRRIWYRLRRAGMVIPFPIRDVNLRPVPADAAEQARAHQALAIRGILSPLPLLAPLSAEQVAEVAAASTMQRYSSGEVLFRQGEAGDSLFVIGSGRVRVDAEADEGRAVTLAQRGPGEVLGEMSLLTGEVRSATATAETECDLVLVPKAAVAGLLLSDPGVAETLAAILAQRAAESETQLKADLPRASTTELQASLLARIRGFFGL